MNTTKAIEQFKERLAIPDYREQIPEYYEAMETAIEALEKQEPKKPINNSWTHYHCPVCMKSVNSKYCGNCGQALDWSEEDDK